jgi:hypothetical protein
VWPQAAAEGGEDLLPGVCALVEAWLGDVVLAGVRDAPAAPPSLGAWFDDPRVALDLRVRCPSHAAYPRATLHRRLWHAA